MRRLAALASLALLAAAPPATAPRPAAAPESDAAWVERTLAGLDLAGKAAQLVMVRAAARPRHADSAAHRELVNEVVERRVGGLVLFQSAVDSIPALLDELQAAAAVPLLVSADLERGLAFRVDDGAAPMPSTMALGATGGTEAARFAGELTAREARAVGIHWILAPVADVNSNPANPVINVRSFGEDPRQVAAQVAAFVEGARAGGALSSAKHFPGHGDTAVDSHLELPRLEADRARLEAVELVPFRAAIAAGVDSVMLGHLAVPALDPGGRPASLSRAIATDLLRGELGFRGLVVTDALEMRGLSDFWMGEAVVAAVEAGADVVLMPPDSRVAVQSLVRAVGEGRLSEARLDESVRRLLGLKARLGLPRERRVDRERMRAALGRPDDAARAEAIARQAVTALRNEGGILPLRSELPLRLLHLVLSSDWANPAISGVPERELERRRIEVETRRLGPEIAERTADEIVTAADRFSHVLVSAFVRVTSNKGRADMDASHARLLERLAAGGRRLIVVSYGSPYLLMQFPSVPVYLCTFSPFESSQRAAIAALFGEFPLSGRLPVSLPGLYALGHGLALPRHEQSLRAAAPEEAGFRPEGLAEIDRLLEQFVARRAFPGGVVALGRAGKLAYLKAFGHLSYEADAPPAEVDTIYDLASLTKVIATTTVAMSLIDEERLQLDRPVAAYLPRFVGAGKEKVTVRHLFAHAAGIDWWAPLYKEAQGKAAYLERILAMPLVHPPGTEMKYSDLGVILLGEILERVSGRSLDELVGQRVTGPLGMRDTGYLPLAERLERIAPTEIDPWRGRLVRGEVHDENAFALGGVAPHAGLFGTAADLARFAQMLLYGGTFEQRRIVARATLAEFTRRAELPPGSSRALGWDTRSATGSSAGTLLSPESFGHTGFTGTSIWIDPRRELFVILLTNRVHPTRENSLIREARPALADAAVRALVDPVMPGAVEVGLDRVAKGEVAALAGKRLGLLSNSASVTLDGRTAVEVFRARRLDLVRLFSPEHGLAARAAAGEPVPSGADAASGLPVVSLYGERIRPRAEDLAGLDALVVDLQDAGVRFYTYASSLIECLEAAAEQGVELIVLDRPNPLGGERIEGPISAPRSEVSVSLVNRAPGPLVHGLTLGEMARLVNARLRKPARLTVIEMRGWRRAMTWFETGRVWLPPSPNLRTAEAAIAYPGVALLEATNVSEGRGSEAPFLRLGAPWLDSGTTVQIPGFRLSSTRFKPVASPAAPQPKHEGIELPGLAVAVSDPSRAEPYRLGVALLADLLQRPGFAWLHDGANLTRLVGTPRLLEALRAGRTAEEIVAADAAAHAAWRRERQPYLLYRGR